MPVNDHDHRQSPTPNRLLVRAMEERGFSNKQLAREIQRQAALETKPVAEFESLVSMVSRWRNGHRQPDVHYRPILRKILGKSDGQLGFEPQFPEVVPAAGGIEQAGAAGQFVVEQDMASLDFNEGRYFLRQSRRLVNRSDEVVTRYLVRVSIDRYPEDPEKSNRHHRDNPLRIDELNLQAWCEDEPMAWEVKLDRDAVKEFWLLFGKFPIYPGEERWIHYSYAVGEDKWGRWFQRAVRLPTKRLEVRLSFPAGLDPLVWGTETTLTAGRRPFRTPIHQEAEQEGRLTYSWGTTNPPLNARYRLEWKFRSVDPPAKDWPSTMTGAELTTRLRGLGIRQEGDAILNQPAKPFDLPAEADEAHALEAELLRYLGRLQELYPFTKGIGLAAPQVGIPRAMAVVKPADAEPFTLINPVVVERSEEQDHQFEGCLSLFDVRGRIPRPLRIRVRSSRLDGSTQTVVYERAVARLALHEIDHLEGRLYTVHLPAGERVISLDDYRRQDTAWQYSET